MAAKLALSQRLASGPAPSFTPSKAKSVFFDVAGYFMVSTSDCNGMQISNIFICLFRPYTSFYTSIEWQQFCIICGRVLISPPVCIWT